MHIASARFHSPEGNRSVTDSGWPNRSAPLCSLDLSGSAVAGTRGNDQRRRRRDVSRRVATKEYRSPETPKAALKAAPTVRRGREDLCEKSILPTRREFCNPRVATGNCGHVGAPDGGLGSTEELTALTDIPNETEKAAAAREKATARAKAYRAAHPDEVKAREKAYRAANAAKISAQKAAYYRANREKMLATKAALYAAKKAPQ